MESIRNRLLQDRNMDAYYAIQSFIEDPIHNSIDEVLELVDAELQEGLRDALVTVRHTFNTDRKSYEEEYRFGQAIIWQEIAKTFGELLISLEKIQHISLCPDLSNYNLAQSEIHRLLSYYAEMQISLSRLEKVLGVDRFLDRVSGATFDVLENVLSTAKSIIETKAEKHKRVFQAKWNTTNVHKVIRHQLLAPNTENQVCDCVQGNCTETLLFVIDGFGFSQYLWNSGLGNERNFTFNENIFHWLSRNQLSRELVLGSSYVTDTGAGLAQIYLGQLSGETGIIASKIRRKNDTTNFLATKSIPSSEFDSTFSYKNSITDLAMLYGKPATVYYCSRYQDPPSGFSKCIFKSADVHQVIPPERVFSMLMEDISDETAEGLKIVYLTGIDNSGHTMGAYSNFERYEHQKVEYLFRNFLIELASNQPGYFDGHHSVLITADHGMFESSKRIVSRSELADFLYNEGIKRVKMVENNRAMLFYNEGYSDNETIKTVLSKYFSINGLSVDVSYYGEDAFDNCLESCKEEVRPDLIARFVGEGLFYTNPQVNEHLLHFGGHGGCSVDEVFVPLVEIPLNNILYAAIQKRFLSRK